ncbi:MAG: SGNH/GDSL hydrolase family protein [Lachnospiraceae bacterium]|nr:SGNH/GDSL hydrolase family protein [Lachnospiraceae bacterium]
MEKINKILLVMIAMAGIMLAAVGIDEGMQAYEAWKWESERLVRYEQAYADVADMQVTISQISQDQEALTAFIAENREYFGMEEVGGDWGAFSEDDYMQPPETPAEETNLSEISGENAGVTGSELPADTDITGNELPGDTDVTGNEQPVDADVTGNELPVVADVTGNELPVVADVTGNALPEGTDVTGNSSVSQNHMDGYDISGNFVGEISGNTLAERQKIRGSYMETQMQNKKDLEAIASSRADFSDISIACLGDSITEAANLSDKENYQQYAYPTRLKELLQAESVTNLGIGGSSIGRYWANAFVDRYKEIPADTDLILVMGGTNDGFCMSEKDIGSMEERKAGTFIGDLDELMRGLKENYPNAEIVFVTPLPNVLHDMLKKEKDYLLPQSALVDVIIQLATEYDIPVIDLYNSNMLDTHDAAVIYNYMPDGVHCNPDGYSVLAEHIAAELIEMYGGEDLEGQEG